MLSDFRPMSGDRELSSDWSAVGRLADPPGTQTHRKRRDPHCFLTLNRSPLPGLM